MSELFYLSLLFFFFNEKAFLHRCVSDYEKSSKKEYLFCLRLWKMIFFFLLNYSQFICLWSTVCLDSLQISQG